jgi:hypothetical protein
MKILMTSILTLTIVMSTAADIAPALAAPPTQQAPMPSAQLQPPLSEPEYAKWGKVALAETKRHYKGSTITMYKHLGRRALNSWQIAEIFQFIVKKDGKQIPVDVRVFYEKDTGRVMKVQFLQEGKKPETIQAKHQFIREAQMAH